MCVCVLFDLLLIRVSYVCILLSGLVCLYSARTARVLLIWKLWFSHCVPSRSWHFDPQWRDRKKKCGMNWRKTRWRSWLILWRTRMCRSLWLRYAHTSAWSSVFVYLLRIHFRVCLCADSCWILQHVVNLRQCSWFVFLASCLVVMLCLCVCILWNRFRKASRWASHHFV